MIILTAEQADKARGFSPTNGAAALEPIPLKDGTFCLPEGVLTDAAHADRIDLLGGLTTATPDPSNVYGPTDFATVAALALPSWKDIGKRPAFEQVDGLDLQVDGLYLTIAQE